MIYDINTYSIKRQNILKVVQNVPNDALKEKVRELTEGVPFNQRHGFSPY